MIENDSFREDLYYRINTIEILVPPLRERKDDIIILSEYFLEEFRRKYSKEDLNFSESFKKYLMEQEWPGNVRQLEAVLRELSFFPNQIL